MLLDCYWYIISNKLNMIYGSYIIQMVHGQKYTITLPFTLSTYKVYRGGQFSYENQNLQGVTLYSSATTSFIIQYCNQKGTTDTINYQYLVIGY